ncbi:hypothetical protein DER46DRAFT_566802 [Fusarium sp. MPI-SDFR-AT-0072]|nr:hypothetical protein DER46DRAFT_566802 [Fusarium sp. MPI-SDFR-AT-0072]KAI7772504.1 hypothetical protein LZL87_014100 [Fusarium oxysporum]
MAPQLPKLTNSIHIRDFVDDVVPDSTRPNAPNYVQIHTNVNVVREDGFYDASIAAEPIRTCIRAYLRPSECDLYVPNTFFYVDGRFAVDMNPDGGPMLTVQSLSLQRHPGDVSDFDEYRRHLPEKWCPMITALGFVGDRNPTPDVPARLAVRVLDLAYLPKLASNPHVAGESAPTKRKNRWAGRADSRPNKRSRTAPAFQSAEDATPPSTDRNDATQPQSQGRSSSESVVTVASPYDEKIAPTISSSAGTRPKRHRQPPKRLSE